MKIEISIEHNGKFTQTHVVEKFPCIVGRGTDCQLQIVDEGISRKHLEITISDEDQAVFVKDLNSRNGTTFGDEQISSTESVLYEQFYLPLELSHNVRLHFKVIYDI